MNIFKDSLFSSSNRQKPKRSSQNQSAKYQFRQANHSLTDPLLYTFENNEFELGTIDSDEESKTTDQHIVRIRHAREHRTPAAQNGGSVVIAEKPVLPNETIQAFAIRYRVPVSQLKRINNIQNDQDFYALTHCRVPVRRFGLLHESTASDPSTVVDLNEQSTISLPITHLSQQNHHAFLSAMDQDLAAMRTKVEQLIETPSTTTTKNTYNQLRPQSVSKRISKPGISATNDLNCDGDDCGCKLWHIVMIILLIALIPFIYAYFYIKSLHNTKL